MITKEKEIYHTISSLFAFTESSAPWKLYQAKTGAVLFSFLGNISEGLLFKSRFAFSVCGTSK